MGLGYRAYFTVRDEPDVIGRSQEQLHSWLRDPRKGYKADLLGAPGVQQIGEHATGVVLEDTEHFSPASALVNAPTA